MRSFLGFLKLTFVVGAFFLLPLVLALLLVCFLAGLVARTHHGRGLARMLEQAILTKVPGSTLLKSMTRDDGTIGSGARAETALALVEDAWVLAFVVERHDNGLLTVFVPSAPTPAVGTIDYLPEERIRRVDVPVQAAVKVIMRLGVGSGDLLRGRIEAVPRR